MSETRISVFEALSHYNPSFNKKKFTLIVLGVSTILSISSSCLLVHITNGWKDELCALFEKNFSLIFKSYCIDMIALNMIQFLLVCEFFCS